jgi:restriction endonuclease S subunit
VKFREDQANKGFLLHALNGAVAEVEENLHGGVGLVHITKGNLERIKIALPPLATQQAFVAEIEAEQALVARIWGKEAPVVSEA